MKIYLLLLIIGLFLYYKDPNKYNIYIEGIFMILGILGIYVFISVGNNADKLKDILIKKPVNSHSSSIGISSILLIISSLGCFAFSGLSYTKKI